MAPKTRKHRQTVALDRKFYVASSTIVGRRDDHRKWRKATVEEAVLHAEEIMQRDDDLEEMYIVEVVRVVRRSRPPVEVLGVR